MIDDEHNITPSEPVNNGHGSVASSPIQPGYSLGSNPLVTAPTAPQPATQSEPDSAPIIAPTVVAPTTTPPPTGDLAEIKQKALAQLSPIVGRLDQTPEEKFRTTMMLIQASDNQDLVKEAYAAAEKIEDEKARAEALLAVVNEINYFAQGGSPSSKTS